MAWIANSSRMAHISLRKFSTRKDWSRGNQRLSPAADGAGARHYTEAINSLLDPAHDAAKIRAFFVHPHWARRGIGGLILKACEDAAREAGFTRLEMGATLSGVAFYKAKGYAALENLEAPLGNRTVLPIVRMAKEFK